MADYYKRALPCSDFHSYTHHKVANYNRRRWNYYICKTQTSALPWTERKLNCSGKWIFHHYTLIRHFKFWLIKYPLFQLLLWVVEYQNSVKTRHITITNASFVSAQMTKFFYCQPFGCYVLPLCYVVHVYRSQEAFCDSVRFLVSNITIETAINMVGVVKPWLRSFWRNTHAEQPEQPEPFFFFLSCRIQRPQIIYSM